MDVARILSDSLRLLKAEPKAFAPRIVTTAIYSVYILAFIGVASDLASVDLTRPNAADSMRLASAAYRSFFFLALSPLLYFVDILSYAMYPRIVADHNSGSGISIRKALKDGLKAWRIVIATEAVLFLFILALAVPTALAVVISLITGNIVYAVLAVILALALILVFAVLVFFVIPSAVLKGRTVAGSFRESVSLGLENRWDILRINVLFLALLAVTVVAGVYVQGNPLLTAASAAAFIILRLLEAVVYTYLCVTNPYAYIHATVNNRREP